MMKPLLKHGLLLAMLCLPAVAGFAAELPPGAFTVHKIYGSNMVLQRQKPISISGMGSPGATVKVELAGAAATTVTDAAGKWVAMLPAMAAGGPYTLTVSGSRPEDTVKLVNVMVGEVWLCSGQSNMEWFVDKSDHAAEEIAAADYPNIRLFNVQPRRYVAPQGPQPEIVGLGWQVCSPQTIPKFSAVGYFFARQLYHDLKVPVGVINSSWGGSPIESWISLEGYQKADRLEEIAMIAQVRPDVTFDPVKLEAKRTFARQKIAAWEQMFFTDHAVQTFAAADWMSPDLTLDGWQAVKQPANFVYDVDGVYWYRTSVDLPPAFAGRDLMLSLGAIDDIGQCYVNGEKVGENSTDAPQYWTVNQVCPIPGRLTQAGKLTIAVRVIDFSGPGGFTGPADRMFVALADQADGPKIMLADRTWYQRVEFKLAYRYPERPTLPNVPPVTKDFYFPSGLYNSMIAPWTKYPMRGFVWYQGETNAGNSPNYMELQPLLIDNWRTMWGDASMPFVFVQLAAYERNTPDDRLKDDFWVKRNPSSDSWAVFREVQTATLKIPHTGMAVAIDCGDHSSTHPTDKQTVGYRLAMEAERLAYGKTAVSSGPLYQGMKVEGDKIRLCFSNTGSGLTARGGALKSFAIAGADGKFVWADAAIDGGTVVVRSDKVPQPAAVRYAWARYPGNPNLYNLEGFPASPFRTDTPDYLIK